MCDHRFVIYHSPIVFASLKQLAVIYRQQNKFQAAEILEGQPVIITLE